MLVRGSGRVWRNRRVGGVSTDRPSAGINARAVAAADAFLQTLDDAQRRKANLDFNEQTRVVWSNLPSGITMQVGAMERNGLKLGAI